MTTFVLLAAATLLNAGWTADGEPVVLPHTWNAEDGSDGLGVEPGRCAHDSVDSRSYARKAVVYRHALPDPKPGTRRFLRFDGVSQVAKIRVNGYPVQSHAGAFTAFACDLTTYLFPGGTNAVEVVVDNLVSYDIPPAGGDFTMCGGIYRDVWLVEKPQVCFDPLTFGGPGVDVTADAAGHVHVVPHVLGARRDEVTVSYEVVAPDGARLSFAADDFTVPAACPWTPETPCLYRLVATLACGTCRDVVEVSFGFRTVELRADGFYLNGQKRRLRGVCRHQDRKGKGWAVSEEDIREDLSIIKAMGADAVRTSHYPPAPAFYSLCDEMGLLVWSEAPLVDDVPAKSPHFAGNALFAACEMVAQHRNHPSVFAWGLFNEIYQYRWDDGSAERVTVAIRDVVRAMDPSRPTVAAGGTSEISRDINSVPDGLGFNCYPGWYGKDGPDAMYAMVADGARRHGRRTVAVSEYGAAGSPHAHGDPRTRCWPRSRHHSEEYQAWCHLHWLRALKSHPDVWGTFAWVMFDAASDARVETDGYNDKGLVTADRKIEKDAYYLYQANWTDRPVLHLVGARMEETTNATATVVVFCNQGDVALSVNGRSLPTRHPDEVCAAVWEDVPLDVGENEIVASSDGLVVKARWHRRCRPVQPVDK